MDVAYEILREQEGWVGHATLDTHGNAADSAITDPAMPDARRDHATGADHRRSVASSPYRAARERKRGGHSMVDDQLKTAVPRTDPAQPEGRLGQRSHVIQSPSAEAALITDPGDAGGESGHVRGVAQSSVAALANDPPQGGAEVGHKLTDIQAPRVSSAKIRKPRGERSAVGQLMIDNHTTTVDSAIIPKIGGDAEGRVGHTRRDSHSGPVDAATEIRSDAEGGVGHPGTVFHSRDADPATITAIRHHWRKRQAWHRAEKALTLQAKALCRGLTDGDKGEADRLYAAALGKGEHAEAAIALGFIMPLVEARDGIEKHRKAVEKHLAKLAKTLPVAAWVEGVRGVGIASLAGIIGEAGDLSAYANPGKLWRRMGVAPHQGRAYATWRSRGGLTAQDWTDAGYSPVRRSVLWNVGACVMKAGGPLKEVYDARKVMELAKCEAIAADPEQRKLFARDGKYAPKLHAHNRAQRYVEKRFLRDLWREWRRASEPLTPHV